MHKFKQSLLSACITLISRKAMAAIAMTLLVGQLTGQALAQTIPLPSALDAANEIRRQEERDRAIRERERTTSGHTHRCSWPDCTGTFAHW